jgi:DNA-binding MarR family transcriptional regulator
VTTIRPIPSEPLARLLDQTARALHSHGYQDGLFPAQWAAMRYFQRVRAPNNTAIQLARFQGLAFGAVARTVRTLIEKGFLRKGGSAGRGRAELIEVTETGAVLLARDPLLNVTATLSNMSPQEKDILAQALARILAELQKSGTDSAFQVDAPLRSG